MTPSKGMRHGKIKERKVINHNRLTYIRTYLHFLKNDYDKISSEFALIVTPKPLQELLIPYCKAIINCINTYPINTDGKVRKDGKLLSNQLREEMMRFDSEYTNYITQFKGEEKLIDSEKVNQLVCDLNSSVNFFVNQHDMIYSSVRVSHWLSQKPTREELIEFIEKETQVIMGLCNKKSPINNRKKDFAIRRFFVDKNEKYQTNINTNRIIPYKILEKEVEDYNNKNPKNTLKLSNKIYTSIRAEMGSNNLFKVSKS